MTTTLRSWQVDDPDQMVVWSPATPPRAVEGPLPLSAFGDRTLALQLAAGQVACRERDGVVSQVWFAGTPRLACGEAAAADDRLWFVRDDVPIAWRWREDAALVVPVQAGQVARLPLRGHCTLLVADPVRLVQSTVVGLPWLDGDRLAAALRTHVQAALEARLGALAGGGALDLVPAQALLEGVNRESLDDDLQDLGLRCEQIAVATPAAAPAGPETPTRLAQPIPGSYDDLL